MELAKLTSTHRILALRLRIISLKTTFLDGSSSYGREHITSLNVNKHDDCTHDAYLRGKVSRRLLTFRLATPTVKLFPCSYQIGVAAGSIYRTSRLCERAPGRFNIRPDHSAQNSGQATTAVCPDAPGLHFWRNRHFPEIDSIARSGQYRLCRTPKWGWPRTRAPPVLPASCATIRHICPARADERPSRSARWIFPSRRICNDWDATGLPYRVAARVDLNRRPAHSTACRFLQVGGLNIRSFYIK